MASWGKWCEPRCFFRPNLLWFAVISQLGGIALTIHHPHGLRTTQNERSDARPPPTAARWSLFPVDVLGASLFGAFVLFVFADIGQRLYVASVARGAR